MIHERLKSVVKYLIGQGVAENQEKLGVLLGYTNKASFSHILNNRKPLPTGFIDKLASMNEKVNKVWIETGQGNMLLDSPMEEAAFISNPNYIMVSVVGQYAAAGYLNGFADATYIEDLPKVPFFIDHEVRGKYMGFEVRGDSMDDNSANSIIEGDTLICRQIKPDLWCHKLHIQKWYFVIVHRTEGIIVKQIIDHNTETGDITIHSLNSFYPDRVLNLKDVAQLFNVVQINRKPRL